MFFEIRLICSARCLRFRRGHLAIAVFFYAAAIPTFAQSGEERDALQRCVALNDAVLIDMKAGRNADAESAVAKALLTGDRPDEACAGLALHTMAAMAGISGELAQAEIYAERSVHTLERIYPADDPVLFRPLHVLASVRLEQGKIGKAREVVERVRTLRIERPEDRAFFHGLAAALHQHAGDYALAEADFLAAIRAWGETGRGETADYASVLTGLASLYIETSRYEDARQTLDRAIVALGQATNAVPMDRVKILWVRAAMHTHQREWNASEQDLREAASIMAAGRAVDPAFLVPFLKHYSFVLRKTHHGGEARDIDGRAAVLAADISRGLIVDASELLPKPKPGKK